MTESTMTANNKDDQNILSFVLFDEDDDDEHDSFINTDILDINQSLKRSYATYIYDDSLSHGNCQSVARTKKPGRKPMIDTDEDEEKIKRKEQNRAAQRAFRERKERYVRELEKKFKQFQDKHAAAIHQLLQENQYLRSVICRLEVENCVLKGTPTDSVDGVIKALEKARTSLPVPPPPSPAAFQLLTKPPLPPLQIRPSSMKTTNQNIDESTKSANSSSSSSSSSHSNNNNNISSRRNNRKTNSNHQARVVETKLASENAAQLKKTTTTTTTTDIPDRDFTFSITTPALLRATSDRLAGNEQVQAVQLYPDHSHPANPLFRKDRKKQQPENNNPINEPVNDDQDKEKPSRTDGDGNNQNNDQEFDNFLKPFLEIHDDLCTNGIVNNTTNNNNNTNNNNDDNNNRNTTALPTERRSSNNDRYQEPTSRIWQRVSEHASNPKFSVDQLLHAVKRSTMLTDDRLVLEEWDMEQMLENF